MPSPADGPLRHSASERPSTFSGVLFDLDGVLVDSMHIVRGLWRSWAAELGLDPRTVSAASRGGPGLETLRRLDANLGLNLDIEAEAQRLADLEHGYAGQIQPIPGAHDTLAAVGAAGVPWAIVTSGTVEVARGRIQSCRLTDPQVLVAAGDASKGKPAPDPYLLGASRLGVDPETCLVIEDSPGGITAGRAAGATVVGLTGSHPAERLDSAHVVIETLAALTFRGAPGGVEVQVEQDGRR